MYSYGRAKAGRPARTYIEHLCADTGCKPEDLTEVMDNNREGGRTGSGIFVQIARHDDDDDDYVIRIKQERLSKKKRKTTPLETTTQKM